MLCVGRQLGAGCRLTGVLINRADLSSFKRTITTILSEQSQRTRVLTGPICKILGDNSLRVRLQYMSTIKKQKCWLWLVLFYLRKGAFYTNFNATALDFLVVL